MATIDTSIGHQITDVQAALKFILAGNAYLTLVSKATGTRYTYRVNTQKKNENQTTLWPEGKAPQKTWFVSLLKGPDNTADYVYLGIIQDNNFRLTRKSRMTSVSKPVQAFAWSFASLTSGVIPANLEIWHHGRCGHCGRMLNVPEYKVNGVIVAGIALGIGPECAGL